MILTIVMKFYVISFVVIQIKTIFVVESGYLWLKPKPEDILLVLLTSTSLSKNSRKIFSREEDGNSICIKLLIRLVESLLYNMNGVRLLFYSRLGPARSLDKE